MSIADNPNEWTSKPRDHFGNGVKKALDERGFGSDSGGDPVDHGAQQVDDGTEHTIQHYRILRSRMDDVRAHCRIRANNAGSEREKQNWKYLADFIDTALKNLPMDGGAY